MSDVVARASARAGVVVGAAPCVVAILVAIHQSDGPLSPVTRTLLELAAIVVAVCLVAGATLRNRPHLARRLFVGGLFGFAGLGALGFAASPLAGLLVGVTSLAAFAIFTYDSEPESSPRARARAFARAVSAGAFASMLAVAAFELATDVPTRLIALASAALSIVFAWRCLRRRVAVITAIVAINALALAIAFWSIPSLSLLAAAVVPLWCGLAIPVDDNRAPGLFERWRQALVTHPARLLVFTFALAGLVGALILALPLSSTGERLHVVDAMFTSFSAVCVTGLTVVDTATAFTGFGQAAVLLLIQVGGLGIMTFSTAAFVIFGERMGVREEAAAVQLLGASDRNALGASLRRVLVVTFVSEFAGAVLLTLMFHGHGDAWGAAIWRGVFTSISAFCNAGFGLQTTNLVPYASDVGVMTVCGLLVVVGGLGPAVITLVPRWIRGKRIAVGARLVLVTTTWLLLVPALLYAALEWDRSLAGLGTFDRLVNAMFMSITPRTAGFNSVDMNLFHPATITLTIGLMFVGGSPSSTAGGIKTTTLAVLMMVTAAQARGAGTISVSRRRIGAAAVRAALAVAASSAVVVVLGLLALQITQYGREIDSTSLLFEVVSALCTVGLTLDVTTHLDAVGRVIVTLIMLTGRVGPLAVLSVFVPRAEPAPWKLPEEQVPIG